MYLLKIYCSEEIKNEKKMEYYLSIVNNNRLSCLEYQLYLGYYYGYYKNNFEKAEYIFNNIINNLIVKNINDYNGYITKFGGPMALFNSIYPTIIKRIIC